MTEEISSHISSSPEPSTRGFVYIFTGAGKGKTSAALGTVFRASGHGLRVYITYFMKGAYTYGERSILSKLPNVNTVSFGQRELIDKANIKPEEIEQARQITEKPKNVELILTGRKADTKLVQLADVVTEMLKIKHPYDKGVMARKGIDY